MAAIKSAIQTQNRIWMIHAWRIVQHLQKIGFGLVSLWGRIMYFSGWSHQSDFRLPNCHDDRDPRFEFLVLGFLEVI